MRVFLFNVFCALTAPGQKRDLSLKTEQPPGPLGGGGGRGTKQPFMASIAAVRRSKLFPRVSLLFTTKSLLSPCPLPLPGLSVLPSLPPGMNTERYGRPSSTWCSQPRWPNTLSTSTSSWTASTSRWLLWRRMGWDGKQTKLYWDNVKEQEFLRPLSLSDSSPVEQKSLRGENFTTRSHLSHVRVECSDQTLKGFTS